jgi:hypothetical protein
LQPMTSKTHQKYCWELECNAHLHPENLFSQAKHRWGLGPMSDGELTTLCSKN